MYIFIIKKYSVREMWGVYLEYCYYNVYVFNWLIWIVNINSSLNFVNVDVKMFENNF